MKTMTKFAKITIDTNVFIRILEKGFIHQVTGGYQDLCSYSLKALEDLLKQLHNALQIPICVFNT